MESLEKYEIRKLKPSQVQELTKILETHELWKKLMSIIPKYLQSSSNCEISLSNPRKYNSEHFRIIENASLQTKRACTEILLDEWGTSGRVLPTVGHLFYLLKSATLYRAADYVAVYLLKQPTPQRPVGGPEAEINVDSNAVQQNIEDKIEKDLNDINYPALAEQRILDFNSQNHPKKASVIPQIIVTSVCEDITKKSSNFNPLIVKSRDNTESSNMIKFSSSSESSKSINHIPAVKGQQSAIIDNTEHDNFNLESEENNSNVPNFSFINKTDVVDDISDSKQVFTEPSNQETGSLPNIPRLSTLVDSGIPNWSAFQSNKSFSDKSNSDEINLPDFNVLNPHHPVTNMNNNDICSADENSSCSRASFGEKNRDESNSDNETNSSLPDFNALNQSPSKLSMEYKIPNGLTASIDSSMSDLTSVNNASSDTNCRPCNSPLPQLSLNTKLPHFNYNDLIIATNKFNENLYLDSNAEGRFLGSGAFGSVYLAFGLLEKPVAVKKLILENVEFVDIDATVTKQFRNEVEVLSHYKHPNLLELVGYSCDGCTYCLLYEYIQGGALNVRLRASSNKLQWKDRIKIAVGTANAVAYLHTAFSTPLIHRDIKSANILLDCSYTPKLCDFGLIKVSPNQNTAVATTVFGTSAYMAPEAFRGDISVKMDTFSFGVVLLELLTSLPPMDENREGRDLVTYVENYQEDSITPLLDTEAGDWSSEGINYSREMYEIALKCLEEKRKRPNMVQIRDMLNCVASTLFV